ncbi:GNAT family N-acetyltransferase [Candidatus Lokiarchaeum ossiferum]|uniref:GNAT family N-acetyltransferase n=1 Tax=Candidatus Lokiarchaeum ossiferum TaxID=2951803 RepID=UPI00352DBD0E
MIRAINSNDELKLLVPIIQKANLTVANEFNLTIQNAPTNPAFITEFYFFEGMEQKKHQYFGYFINQRIVGCLAIRLISEKSYGIDRLAVLPEFRHQGFGEMLIQHVENHIKSLGGKKILIGIIFENKLLLNWYLKLRFILTGTKKFDHLPFTVGFMEKNI